jgi:hypothetical protein
MFLNQIELSVIIKGRPITEYHHQGQVFVEGRTASEYEVLLRNKTNARVEIVLSVDGLSVIDGKPAGQRSSGYLINGDQSITVPGWTLNDRSVAKFAFSGHGESYTEMSGGDPRNNGVIGVMAFTEQPIYNINHGYVTPPIRRHRTTTKDQWYNNEALSNSMHNFDPSASLGGIISPMTSSSSMSAPTSFTQSSYVPEVNTVNSLGTAFGDATEFATVKVAFIRGGTLATMTLYYDDAKGLRSRGIEMRKPRKRRDQPEAFPAMQEGCVPPPGWRR